MGEHARTFSRVTRSAACNNVNPEISFTMRDTVASFVLGRCAGIGVEEGSVAVVKHLESVAVLE